MEDEVIMSNIILSMREYQKENNITRQCVANAQYLYDTIKMNYSFSFNNIKTKAVIVFSNNNEEQTQKIVAGHLVIELDDGLLIEPSYDVFSLKNKSYFDNIKDLLNTFDNKDEFKTNIKTKKLIYDHINFVKISEQINNGELLIAHDKDKWEHYNKQADYVEKIYTKKRINID